MPYFDSGLIAVLHTLSLNYPFPRLSSAPYISGDSFLDLADYVLDAPCNPEKLPFSPEKIAPNSVIFLKGSYLDSFFNEIHPKISAPYILLTHNDDRSIPGPFLSYLEDKKIIAWFGQNNIEIDHPKLYSLPIGLPNRYWEHGDIQVLEKIKGMKIPKKHLLSLNFSIETNDIERKRAANFFSPKSFAVKLPYQNYPSYLSDLAASYFVLSPPGKGFDCHRTWEALYMGAYPVVLSSKMNEFFKDLPVLIVKNWEDLSEEFLQKKYEEMESRTYNWEKLSIDFWSKKLRSL